MAAVIAHQHATTVCRVITTGLRDLTGFEDAEYPGVAKALPGGTVSVDFENGRYTGVEATLIKGSRHHFSDEGDIEEEVDAWSHVSECIHWAIVNELPDAVYPNGTVHMVYASGRMHPVLQ
jgi:hypothetical protein